MVMLIVATSKVTLCVTHQFLKTVLCSRSCHSVCAVDTKMQHKSVTCLVGYTVVRLGLEPGTMQLL